MDIIHKMFNKTRTQTLLRDFPWLWAINHCPTIEDHKNIKVSQNTENLKMVLSQTPEGANYSVWTITAGSYCTEATCLPRKEDMRWAEIIMQKTHSSSKVLYIVTVVSRYNIVIFRNPKKKPFNDLIEEVCLLHGLSSSWYRSPLDY